LRLRGRASIITSMTENLFDKIAQCPPAAEALAGMEPEARRRLEEAARVVQMPAGATLFRPGDLCENYLVVLKGAARITLTSETGREILLYRVEPGQSCVLTTAALMSESEYDAEGATETEVEALVIPSAVFAELLAASAVFRKFVFSSFAIRLQDLIGLVGEVAFSRLDRRLAAFLVKRGGDAGEVAMTHQEIAAEVGSTREAVSRLRFQRRDELIDFFFRRVMHEGEAQDASFRIDAQRLERADGIEIAGSGHDAQLGEVFRDL